MTPIEKKLAISLLNLAADEFGNHGCNDFDLIRNGGLTTEEAQEVQASLVRDGVVDEVGPGTYTMDWLLMRWLVHRINALPPKEPQKICVYAGSFDPVTIGHLDVITRATELFDKVIVAIGRHPTKKPMFSLDNRQLMLGEITKNLAGVETATFSGLLIDYCKRIGASAIIRGLRATSDFEYELQIAHANASIEPSIDTIFLPTRTKYGFISSSLVRELLEHGGDISGYVPPAVVSFLR